MTNKLKHLLSFLLVLSILTPLYSQPDLRVSDNKRYLAYQDGI